MLLETSYCCIRNVVAVDCDDVVIYEEWLLLLENCTNRHRSLFQPLSKSNCQFGAWYGVCYLSWEDHWPHAQIWPHRLLHKKLHLIRSKIYSCEWSCDDCRYGLDWVIIYRNWISIGRLPRYHDSIDQFGAFFVYLNMLRQFLYSVHFEQKYEGTVFESGEYF